MAKVMERVHSGGMAKGNPNQPKESKAENPVKKSWKTKNADGTVPKKADMAATKALAAKLVQLKEKFLNKADTSYLSHPCQWTDIVQGNATPFVVSAMC